MVETLLDINANIETTEDVYGRTPLFWVAQEGHEEVVKILLTRNANCEARDDEKGQTPLSAVAENGHESVVELLIAKDSISRQMIKMVGHRYRGHLDRDTRR